MTPPPSDAPPLDLSPEWPEDLLARHAAALRALARGLLRDEHAADDVVQETWLAALERPPRSRERLAGWLRQVTRSHAMMRRRGEGRRAERESRATDDRAPVDGNPTGREILREVIDAVLGLEEPYQSTVVERFFQDLPPREIARRRGVPVTTVKSQLTRALARLRDRLDTDAGDRGRWACALAVVTGLEWRPPVPAAEGSASSGTPGGGILMEWKIVIGTSVAAAALIGTTQFGALSHATSGDGGGNGGAAAANQRESAGALAEPSGEGARDEVRAPVPASAAAFPLVPSQETGEFAFALRGVVVDENDLPVHGAHVYIGPELSPMNDWGETGPDGTFALRWRSDEPSLTVALSIRKSYAYWSGLELVELAQGSERSLRIRVHSNDNDKLRLTEEKAMAELLLREQAEAGDARFDPPRELKAGLEHLERTTRQFRIPYGFFGGNLDRAVGLATGDGTKFRWPLSSELDVRYAYRVQDEMKERKLKEVLAQERRVEQSERREKEPRSDTPPPPPGLRSLSVSISDAAGNPTPGAPVWGVAESAVWEMKPSDASFELTGLDSEEVLELRAGGGDLGIATTVVPKGETSVHWEAVLDRGEEVKGVLRGPDGAPLEGWIVEFRADGDTPWHDATRTARDGSFAIPNVGATVGRLWIRESRAWTLLPARVVEDVFPGTEPIEIELRAADLGLGEIQLSFVGIEEEEQRGIEVRAWQLSSGRGTWLVRNRKHAHFTTIPLPVGRYRIVAGTLDRGYAEVATVEVTADQTVDLGQVALPAPARLTLPGDVPTPLGGRADWTLVRRGVVDAHVAEGTAELFDATLPAGEYALFIESEHFRGPETVLVLEPGSSAAPSPDVTDFAPVTLEFEAGPGELVFDVRTVEGERIYRAALGEGRRARIFLAPGSYRVGAQLGEKSSEIEFDLGDGTEAVRLALD